MNSDMKTNPSTLVRIYVSLFLEGNGLTLFYQFQCLHLLSQLLLVQIHSLSEPCKQPTIQQQTSCILRVQILVLYTGRSRWNTFSIMWRVVIKNVNLQQGVVLYSEIKITHQGNSLSQCCLQMFHLLQTIWGSLCTVCPQEGPLCIS